MNDIQKNYNQLLIRYDEILKENESLKALLRSHGISYAGNMFEQVRDNLYSNDLVPEMALTCGYSLIHPFRLTRQGDWEMLY